MDQLIGELTSKSSDHRLIKATKLNMHQIHKLIIGNLLPFIKVHQQRPVMSKRKELKVTHVRQERKSNITRITKRLQINPKVALRRSIHGTNQRQFPITVVLKSRNILSHGASNHSLNELCLRPKLAQNSLPRLLATDSRDFISETRVRGWKQCGHAWTAWRVCYEGTELASSNVLTKVPPVSFQEGNGSQKCGGEDGTEA